MRIHKHPTLVKRFIEARVKKLRAERPVLVASLVRTARNCGRLNFCVESSGFRVQSSEFRVQSWGLRTLNFEL